MQLCVFWGGFRKGWSTWSSGVWGTTRTIPDCTEILSLFSAGNSKDWNRQKFQVYHFDLAESIICNKLSLGRIFSPMYKNQCKATNTREHKPLCKQHQVFQHDTQDTWQQMTADARFHLFLLLKYKNGNFSPRIPYLLKKSLWSQAIKLCWFVLRAWTAVRL